MDINQDINESNSFVCQAILGAAKQAIQRRKGKITNKAKECKEAIKSQNKAFN